MTNNDKGKNNKQQLRHRNAKKHPKASENGNNGSSNSKDMTDDELLALELAVANNKANKTQKHALLIGAGVVVIVALLVSSWEWPPLLLFGNSTNNNDTTLTPTATNTSNSTKNETPPQIEQITKFVSDYKILRKLPHDTQAYTQGLTFRPDNHSILYECTGMYKASKVRVLDLQTNNNQQEQEQEETVLEHIQIPDEFFGEGMTFIPAATNDNDDTDKDNPNPTPGASGRLVFLTWREKTGFVLDVDTLQVLENFTYETTTGEGWGIVHVPTPPKDDDNNDNNNNNNNQQQQQEPYEFIVTDGSDNLLFWDRHYRETHRVPVTFRTGEMAQRNLPPRSLKMLNELEWDATTQTLLANIYFQDYIARIDPRTGFVTTLYDLRSLYTDRHPKADVFNGIALNSQGDLWVTGKYWPFLYQIQLGDDYY